MEEKMEDKMEATISCRVRLDTEYMGFYRAFMEIRWKRESKRKGKLRVRRGSVGVCMDFWVPNPGPCCSHM